MPSSFIDCPWQFVTLQFISEKNRINSIETATLYNCLLTADQNCSHLEQRSNNWATFKINIKQNGMLSEISTECVTTNPIKHMVNALPIKFIRIDIRNKWSNFEAKLNISRKKEDIFMNGNANGPNKWMAIILHDILFMLLNNVNNHLLFRFSILCFGLANFLSQTIIMDAKIID